MHSEWRIIPTGLNKLQGTEVSALFLNAWKKESCNVYVLMTLLSRSARRVNVTNVNTTSCSSVVLLPCGKRVSFRQTRGWEQPKLARNEKISLSRQPQLQNSQNIYNLPCIRLHYFMLTFSENTFNVQTDLAVTIANHNQDRSN